VSRRRRPLRFKGQEQPDWVSTLLGGLFVLMIVLALLSGLVAWLDDLLGLGWG